MKTQPTPKSAICACAPSPTLTRLASLACALGLAGSALAQNIPRQPYADSTHTVRLQGVPKGTDWCPAGQVWSGGACVALPTATSGATLLPYSMPVTEQVLTNQASYPLMLNVYPTDGCYAMEVYVDGSLVGRTLDACEDSNTSISAIVPAGSTFQIQGYDPGPGKASRRKGASTRVTALANGAKWQDTGIYWTWTEIVDRKYVSPVPGFYCTSFASIPGIYDYYLKNFDNYTGYVKRTGPFQGNFFTGQYCPFDGA